MKTKNKGNAKGKDETCDCRETIFAELLAAAKCVLECGDRGCGDCLNRLEKAVAKAKGKQ